MTANAYETQRYLDEYLLFHYGQPRDLCPFPFVPGGWLNFHERIRVECLLPLPAPRRGSQPPRRTRGLDLGCAVGRFTFELGRVVDEVLGLDNSSRFVRAARRIARREPFIVRAKQSGSQFTSRPRALPSSLRQSEVEFQVGDAMDLGALPTHAFQVVAALNLLCRLPHPHRFLAQLHRLVASGGQLVLASPFSWLAEHTPRREWLSASDVQSLLRPHFRLVRRRDLPFLIREHRRKYQLVISEVMVFVRRKTKN